MSHSRSSSRALGSLLAGAFVAMTSLPTAAAPQSGSAASVPDIVVITLPLQSGGEDAAASLDYAARSAVIKSARFRLLDLSDVLDPEGARIRASRQVLADEALAASRKAYDELDSVKAHSDADRAISAYLQTDLTSTLKSLREAWLLKIASLSANGQTRSARVEMENLLAVDPTVQFSPNIFPPEEIQFAERLRRELSKSRLSLEVRTQPPGAEVYVDAQYRGISPVVVKNIAPGDHFVTVKAAGFALAQQKARPGTETIVLRRASQIARYEEVIRSVVAHPFGKERDSALRSFATWAKADQALLVLVEEPPGAPQGKVTGLRLDAADGHNHAFAEAVTELTPDALAGMSSWPMKLLQKDEPRDGRRIVTHYREVAGNNWKKTTGYILLGTGAALLASAAILGLQASNNEARLQESPQTDVERSNSLRSAGRTYAILADVSLVLGIGAVGTGTYFAFFAKPPPPAE